MRANLILGLEQEPWRSTIEDVIAEHPEGQRIARRVAAAGEPTRKARPSLIQLTVLACSLPSCSTEPTTPAPHPRSAPPWGPCREAPGAHKSRRSSGREAPIP